MLVCIDQVIYIESLWLQAIIHRDIKGQNILVDGRGVCKLADFGASKYLPVIIYLHEIAIRRMLMIFCPYPCIFLRQSSSNIYESVFGFQARQAEDLSTIFSFKGTPVFMSPEVT